MTGEEILAMPASEEMDKLVALALGDGFDTRQDFCPKCSVEEVAEWQVVDGVFQCRVCGKDTPVKNMYVLSYSTDPATTIVKVWEELPQERGILDDVGSLGLWWCSTSRRWEVFYWHGYDEHRVIAHADTIELAICRAFLILSLEKAK